MVTQDGPASNAADSPPVVQGEDVTELVGRATQLLDQLRVTFAEIKSLLEGPEEAPW